MPEIFIPTLHSFATKNTFTGSCGDFRFRAEPNVVMATAKEVDFTQSSIRVEYWHGPFSYKNSQMEGENIFPMTEEGRLAMKSWLEENI
jgi:hypothetical protein